MAFRKGQSGNPAGKPKGARNRTTLAAEALLDGEADAITRTAIEMAKNGDATALRLCLERIVSPRRDRAVTFDMPPLQKAEDAVKATEAILTAVARGDVTPNEAGELAKIVETYSRAVTAADHEARLKRLEDRK